MTVRYPYTRREREKSPLGKLGRARPPGHTKSKRGQRQPCPRPLQLRKASCQGLILQPLLAAGSWPQPALATGTLGRKPLPAALHAEGESRGRDWGAGSAPALLAAEAAGDCALQLCSFAAPRQQQQLCDKAGSRLPGCLSAHSPPGALPSNELFVSGG